MGKRAVQYRTADSRGRITLGEAYANRRLIIESRGDELILRLARVIPDSEAWLYDNPVALDSVRRGLSQARTERFAGGPNLKRTKRAAKPGGD